MLDKLKQLEATGEKIQVGLIGAGAMGLGIAWQVGQTPGMELSFIADLDLSAARNALRATVDGERHGKLTETGNREVLITDDALSLMERESCQFDVLVESTNSIGPAARYCLAAIDREAHVVLMNAEVDLAVGRQLQDAATARGVVLTSDAGDQHGVLSRMMEEIQMWGFRLVQAGNIKGFLDRHATADRLIAEAAARNLDPLQCCAYTDGTKLSIEMAAISNAWNLPPFVDGMEGPKCDDVSEVTSRFDFDAYQEQGYVDYILGAKPGGGVYVVGYCDNPMQAEYLSYYKLGKPPYYTFYRPYHLCHLETPRAIALAALYGQAVMTPRFGRVADVYAHAKRDLKAGDTISHGIGGDEFYGLIKRCSSADKDGGVPIALLEPEGGQIGRMRVDLPRDQALRIDDIELPDTYLNALFAQTTAQFTPT